MRHGSLFSGIGGFDLAAQWMGWENVFQVEIDPFCQKVLEKNFPNTKRHGDIKEFDGTQYRGAIDILSAGPPCQPTSIAGERAGENDDRWLWPEAIRIFGEIRPGVGVFENPIDILTLGDGSPFERICLSLVDLGYRVEPFGIPAASVSAWHERDRVWIIAYSNTQGLQITTRPQLSGVLEEIGTSPRSEPSGVHAARRAYRQVEPGVVRMVHGLPNRVDRIKGLGNAIDPHIAFEIFKAIQATIEP